MRNPFQSAISRSKTAACNKPSTKPVRLSTLATALLLAGAAWAQGALVNLDIPAQPLDKALNALALQSNARVVFATELTDGKTAPALKGTLAPREALDRLLTGSGLRARQEGQTLTVERVPVATPAPLSDKSLATVTVTESAFVPGELPKPYAGGQVARGARVGVLGNADILETPFSINSFTSEFKEDLQAKSVSDVLRYAPSVQTPQLSESTQNDILFIRGFLNVSGSGTFDGLPGLLFRQPPIQAVERIELLLGASAFATGQADGLALGGIVNLVPKRADDKPLTRLGLEFTGRSNFGPTVDIGRRFGQDNAWGIRVNGAYSDGELSLKDANRRSAVGSVALDYRGERLLWTLDHIAHQRNQSPQGANSVGLAAAAAVPAVPSANRIAFPDVSLYDRDFRLTASRLTYQLTPDWEATAAYGVRRDTETQRGFNAPRVFNAAGDATVFALFNSRLLAESSSGEVALRGKIQTGSVSHKISMGATDISSNTTSVSMLPTFSAFDYNIYNPPSSFPQPNFPSLTFPPFKGSDSSVRGLFVSDQLGFFDDRLLLTLGLRSTRIETNAFNATTGARTGGFADRATTPALGILFKVSPVLSVYANAVEALQQGAIAPATAANANEQFPPLVSKQVELGAKYDFGKLAATLALFRIERASQFTDPRTNRFTQDGLQTNTGIEASVFGEVQRGLRLYSGFSAINGKLKRTANGTFDGKDAPDVPDYTLTAHLDWDVPGLPGLALQGGVVRTGKAFFDNANTQVVPAWTRFDLGLRYITAVAGRKTVFRMKVENAADKNFFTGDRGGLIIASPRTFLLSATVDF